MIKEYFSNYFLHMSDVTFDMATNSMEVHQQNAEPWRVTLVDTGQESMTGGRVKRVASYLCNEPFMLTYGDGVADIDIAALVAHHKQHGRQATVTSIQPMGRFGALDLTADNRVLGFKEKPKGDGSWVNGGFFVLEPGVLDRISGDATVFEKEPLEGLAGDGELVAYKHDGFWLPMDTLRDKNHLEELWSAGSAPWKLW
jgi:glucose-1-phosphate cytidylyltransferase